MSSPPPPPPSDGDPRLPPWRAEPVPSYEGFPGFRSAEVVATRTNNMAIASLVMGIAGVFLCCLWLPQVLAIVFGAVALNQIRNDPPQSGRGMAIAGLVLGIVGLGLAMVAVAVTRLTFVIR